ncbi:MAG TPA: hypothetical protein VMS22_19835 [Candidatus Eisenbacteria bacterium]|nr:hypothetical protein [Candidatus Eisenbacteria bacterium]
MQQAPSNVIAVDFARRRRARPSPAPAAESPGVATARQLMGSARDFLLFWRPPARRSSAEYLGGRWDWGWTLFVWTNEAAVGPLRMDLGSRGYLAQWLTREGFLSFLHRATDIGGLLLDGELEDGGEKIRSEPHQLVRRTDALAVLEGRNEERGGVVVPRRPVR